MAKPKTKKPRRREKKNIAHGQAHIKSTFNNTIVTITDLDGNTISWASAGNVGFKGSRKSTPFAAQLAAEAAARRAQENGMTKVDVFVKGPGSGRETAIRSLAATGLEILGIQDVTAGDIQPPAGVEILNPEQHIATLGRGASLDLELVIQRGVGYVPAERNKNVRDPIGVIPVDSIFSPVRRVTYAVENTRVEQMTDRDRL